MLVEIRGIEQDSNLYINQLITKEDLINFKEDLLAEIRRLLSTNDNPASKKWLKSNEVRKLLSISAGSLQTLRVNGTLPYTKIGGAFYYNYNEIEKLLKINKTSNT